MSKDFIEYIATVVRLELKLRGVNCSNDVEVEGKTIMVASLYGNECLIVIDPNMGKKEVDITSGGNRLKNVI